MNKEIINLEDTIESITYFLLTIIFFIGVPLILNKFNLWRIFLLWKN